MEQKLLAKKIRFRPSHSLRGMLRKTPRFMAMGETVTNKVASNSERCKSGDVGSVWCGRTSPAYPRLELVVIPWRKMTLVQKMRKEGEEAFWAERTSVGTDI